MDFLVRLFNQNLSNSEVWTLISFVICVSIFMALALVWNQPGLYLPTNTDKDELNHIWEGVEDIDD